MRCGGCHSDNCYYTEELCNAIAAMHVSAFSKGPTMDVNELYNVFPDNAQVLDVGCGEGRNSVFMAKPGKRNASLIKTERIGGRL